MRATLPRFVSKATAVFDRGSAEGDVKVRNVVRLLRDDGWYLARPRGSHQLYKHPVKPGHVTVPGSGNHDLALRTLRSILKQAGLKPRMGG